MLVSDKHLVVSGCKQVEGPARQAANRGLQTRLVEVSSKSQKRPDY